MPQITFFEKPGCINNMQQKAWLRAQGVEVVAVNLLDYRWNEAELLSFLGTLQVSEWFNRSAPRVKTGEVVPEQMTREHALQTLLQEPLLIRRPLLRKDNERRVGFDICAISNWLGIHTNNDATLGEVCPNLMQPCVIEEESL